MLGVCFKFPASQAWPPVIDGHLARSCCAHIIHNLRPACTSLILTTLPHVFYRDPRSLSDDHLNREEFDSTLIRLQHCVEKKNKTTTERERE